jgi:hypothetical protein
VHHEVQIDFVRPAQFEAGEVGDRGADRDLHFAAQRRQPRIIDLPVAT